MHFKSLLLSLILMSFTSFTFGQHTERMNEIRSIYKDYNETLKMGDPSYDVMHRYEEGGFSESSVKIYSDYDGKALIIDEFGADGYMKTIEYYFEDGEIAFIFSTTTAYESHVSIRYEISQLRVYFNQGEVIKALEKEFNGEGDSRIADLRTVSNQDVTDRVSDNYPDQFTHKQRITKLKLLVEGLDNYFME